MSTPLTPPEDPSTLELSKPKDWATGLPAVKKSLEHVYGAAGPVRGSIALARLNQRGGFDCPSCAWPDPDDHRSPAEFCENGAKATASETTLKTITRDFFAQHSIADLLQQSDSWHEQQGRLAEPMVRRPGATHYEPITWDAAFCLLADELKALPSPDDGIFYTSGRASNEAAFLYQLMVRQFGTNNLPDCSNMCHESSGAALSRAIGIGKGTVTLDDFEVADTIICIGQNPGTNHPRMLSSLEKAVKKGATVIAVNPLKEAGLQAFANPQNPLGLLNKATPLASQYYQVKPAGDHALLRALAKQLFEWETEKGDVIDHQFIKDFTTGFDRYQKEVESSDWDDLCALCDLSRDQIETFARTLLNGSRRIITCWAMGLTQQRHAVDTIAEVAHLHFLLGAIGRPGAGLCPVRGHSNVQGDRTMGIWEKMSDSFHDRLDEVFQFKSPRKIGYDTVEAIKAMAEKPGQVFLGLGGNFLQASPDTSLTGKALENCRLTAHLSTKLNRSHLITGEIALILPCLGRSDRDARPGDQEDQFLTTENSMGVVQSSTGMLEPVSEDLLSEPQIIAGIAEKLIGNTPTINWEALGADYDEIRELIAKTIDGCDLYNSRVREKGGFYLPNGPRDRNFTTVSKKAEFHPSPVSKIELQPDQFLLQTLRSHDQYNTTVYGMDDRYRGIGHARRIVFLNPDDLKALGLRPLDKVTLTSHWDGETRSASDFQAIPYDLPRQSAATYFPEANVLVPIDQTALVSNTPVSKGLVVTISAD